jgi:phosphatidylcholine synthase
MSSPGDNSGLRSALAFAVHILTAAGAALALLALLAATRGEWALMFLWLGAALAVDAIDGPIARAVKVAERLPRWSGETLDLVVDFTTYVFVPAYAIAASGLMPDRIALPAGLIVAVSGTLYFADRNMKTADNFFQGFPAVWNLIAFYLLLLKPAAAVCVATVALFAVLTFVPMRFVHPLRVRRLRTVTVALLMLWAVLAAAALKQGLAPESWITAGLCLLALYFLAFGLWPAPREQV